MAKKKITLNFFQLIPQEQNHTDDDVKAITDIFCSDTAMSKSVQRGDFKVSLNGEITKREGLFFGTLIHTQMTDIPPSHNPDTGKVQKLSIDAKAGLGYQTNFAYDPSLRIVMIESVNNGVKIGGLCALLNTNFDLPMLDAAIVINPTELAKLQRMGTIKRFSVKIAKLENGSLFTDLKDKSFGQVTKSADKTNTDKMEFALVAGRLKGESLGLTVIRNWIRELIKYKDTHEVEKMIVVGKETDESKSEEIDFIKQRVKDAITIERERLVGSFEASDRQSQMLAVYKKHKQSLYEAYKLKKRE